MWSTKVTSLIIKMPPGGILSVRDERGTVLGKAFYSSKSQSLFDLLLVETPNRRVVLSKETRPGDRLRERLASIHYSAAGLLRRRPAAWPDWDRYGDRLVVQSLTRGRRCAASRHQDADRAIPAPFDPASK